MSLSGFLLSKVDCHRDGVWRGGDLEREWEDESTNTTRLLTRGELSKRVRGFEQFDKSTRFGVLRETQPSFDRHCESALLDAHLNSELFMSTGCPSFVSGCQLSAYLHMMKNRRQASLDPTWHKCSTSSSWALLPTFVFATRQVLVCCLACAKYRVWYSVFVRPLDVYQLQARHQETWRNLSPPPSPRSEQRVDWCTLV